MNKIVSHCSGPIISEIMTKIEDAQLDGIIKTREQALEYLKILIKS